MSSTDLLEKLVAIPSPTGSEDRAVAFLRQQAKNDGVKILDDPVGNFVVEMGTGDRLLLFVGHIDTVPGHIAVRVDNGSLWGRGSVDAKGPLVAAYAAALRYSRDPRIKIRIVGAVDEEGRSRGAKAVPADLDPEWIIIGEPSGADGLTLGYKGILRGVVRAQRERIHGAHRGRTAVEDAIDFWHAVRQKYAFEEHFETLQGRLDSLQTTTDGLNDRVEGRFNIRLPPTVDPEPLVKELEALAKTHGIELDVDETMRGSEAPRRGPLVAAFLSAIRARGGTPHLKRKTGTADFNLFAQRHPNVPIVAYGPGDAALDHTPHERIDLVEFHNGIETLADVIGRLASLPARGIASPAIRPAP